VVILYSFVGSIATLCNCCYLNPPASRACYDVHEALGGAFLKRHHVDCGLIARICKVPFLGRYRASLLSLSAFFYFVCCNKWLDPNKFLLEKTHFVFHCQEHSSFHSYRSTSVLFF
jgi:hypothetical protein